MRIVLDTNVLVSGIFWGGNPGHLVDEWVSGVYCLLVTPPIITEYTRVIKELAARHDPDIVTRWTQYLSEMATTVIPLPVSVQCRDQDDQKFLECAYGGKAEMLITGDADLLAMKIVHDIPILPPNKAILHD